MPVGGQPLEPVDVDRVDRQVEQVGAAGRPEDRRPVRWLDRPTQPGHVDLDRVRRARRLVGVAPHAGDQPVQAHRRADRHGEQAQQGARLRSTEWCRAPVDHRLERPQQADLHPVLFRRDRHLATVRRGGLGCVQNAFTDLYGPLDSLFLVAREHPGPRRDHRDERRKR